jgi:hypothetical protein
MSRTAGTREDDPVTLADAANHFGLSKGVLKADGLRGKLAMYKLGKQYYTTPNAVREWVERCRVERQDRASISIKRDGNGQSVTDRISSAQDALRRNLNGLKSSSRST